MTLSKTQQTALQDLSIRKATHESWASYVELTGVSKGVSIRTLEGLVKKGLAAVNTTHSTSQVPAGPFGSTRNGWRTHHHTTYTFTITPFGLAGLS